MSLILRLRIRREDNGIYIVIGQVGRESLAPQTAAPLNRRKTMGYEKGSQIYLKLIGDFLIGDPVARLTITL